MAGVLRLGVLLSGGGTTLQNFFEKIDAGELPAEVVVVISSRPGVKGLERAEKRNVPTHVIRPKDYPDVESFSEANTRILDEAKVDLVCMAGYLSLWKIPKQYEGRVMNIHPALIPSFCGQDMYGHHVHEAVVGRGVKVSGCTVHFADNRYDAGPIIVQRPVPVFFEDDPDTVAARVFEQECMAYPEAIRLFAAGRLQIEGGRVRILPEGKG
ncbi:MAG: phosphoribosylglycinamide formyltransferase [Phycisphaerae bacterium]|jgi:formyltetrahydrofolate-dependent phosphoribosylglycinamide formyltransferase|nr:phosphoribosylglycinamide formyltransferase [Phycisphaerae bacterium]